jgi:ribosomal protein S18 acetylase RimI-like enzyme
VTAAGTPAGACWLRLFPADDPGYGYVAADVPELSMGVVPGHRRRGVGRLLLRAVLADARAAGLPAVSLSVERANAATRLYAAEGFRTVASYEDADTMLASLADQPGGPSGEPDG